MLISALMLLIISAPCFIKSFMSPWTLQRNLLYENFAPQIPNISTEMVE